MLLARAWSPAVALMVAIGWLSHRPQWPSPLEGYPDWLLHGLAYGALGAACYWGASAELRRPGARAALLALVVAVGYGAFDEWHQSLVPGRDASLHDWLADAVGALAGSAAAWACAAIRRAGPAHRRGVCPPSGGMGT